MQTTSKNWADTGAMVSSKNGIANCSSKDPLERTINKLSRRDDLQRTKWLVHGAGGSKFAFFVHLCKPAPIWSGTASKMQTTSVQQASIGVQEKVQKSLQDAPL